MLPIVYKMAMKSFSAPSALLLVAGLGYFVDAFDLLLYSVVRIPSLTDLGLRGDTLTKAGADLLSLQMIGGLIGGVFWGIMGDRYGRLSSLFGTILVYSLANIGNAFVTTVDQYAICRIVAGFGLAGEVGVGITMVAEAMHGKARGYGATVFAVLGISGTIAAGLIGDLLPWRTAYLIGGGMGLALLLLRVSVHETDLFIKTKHAAVPRGDMRLLFNSFQQSWRFLLCILAGMSVWYMIGLLLTFAPEIAQALHYTQPIKVGEIMIMASSGMALGGIFCGTLGQIVQSRKHPMLLFLGVSFAGICLLLLGYVPQNWLNPLYFIVGFFSGIQPVYLLTVAEQFGTNLRATVATAAPNFMRASTVPIITTFMMLKPLVGSPHAALIVAVIVYALCLVAILGLRETYDSNLDFVER